MNRLEQDAADTLRAHEAQTQFRDAERARWARAKGAVMIGTWAPPALTPAQQQAHDEYVKQHNCPF